MWAVAHDETFHARVSAVDTPETHTTRLSDVKAVTLGPPARIEVRDLDGRQSRYRKQFWRDVRHNQVTCGVNSHIGFPVEVSGSSGSGGQWTWLDYLPSAIPNTFTVGGRGEKLIEFGS
jgi:hypothetical protein